MFSICGAGLLTSLVADLIALGVVIAVGNCGDLEVPLRGGRVDATEAGPPGVPEPQSDLSDTLGFFSVSGFDTADAIGLTACGHSVGHIHHANFADVVPESAVTPNNTGGGEDFDTTPVNFDINVVHEYLTGEGQGGGPLVTTANVTVRSDLRLYESDRNATMKTLGQSREYFFSRCNQLFEKMINTVPREVQLSDVIQPASVKPVNVTFDIESNNTLRISGYIRVSQTMRRDLASIADIVEGTICPGNNSSARNPSHDSVRSVRGC
jgi:hypothetical protein